MKILVALILSCIPIFAAAQLRFGVISPHDADAVVPWESMESYFSQALGMPVRIVRHPPNRIGQEFVAGKLSVALVNPVTAVELIESGSAVAIGTLKANGIPYFAGTIVARRDRHIATLADLKGKDVLAYQKSSAGAYIFQLYHLLQNGIDPFKDLKSLRHNNKQDDIVLAVYEGRIDAGFVRTGIIEALAAKGKIKLNELIVVDERRDGLSYRHTTALYPERFLLVSTRMDETLRNRVTRAALSLKPGDPAARAAGIDGFVKPLGLEKVREALRALHLPPFG